MRATFIALEPEENRYRFPSVRGHGPLLQEPCGSIRGHKAAMRATTESRA